jgi:hypothetical protein
MQSKNKLRKRGEKGRLDHVSETNRRDKRQACTFGLLIHIDVRRAKEISQPSRIKPE